MGSRVSDDRQHAGVLLFDERLRKPPDDRVPLVESGQGGSCALRIRELRRKREPRNDDRTEPVSQPSHGSSTIPLSSMSSQSRRSFSVSMWKARSSGISSGTCLPFNHVSTSRRRNSVRQR
jgi:hypothetical protein